MRYLFGSVVLYVTLAVTSTAAAAQSEGTGMPSEGVVSVGATDQDLAEPTPTPQIVYVVVTATPGTTQTATPAPVLYQTRKGARTEEGVRKELSDAGYAGPWDVAAMLAAYERATAPTPTPTPTPTVNPVVLECQGVPGIVTLLQSSSQDVARAEALNNYQGLRYIAANLRARSYPTVTLPMVNAFLRVVDWDAAGAEIRANWTALTIAAAQTRNGYLLMAAAQADLSRDDGEGRAALVDFNAAIQQLAATCGR